MSLPCDQGRSGPSSGLAASPDSVSLGPAAARQRHKHAVSVPIHHARMPLRVALHQLDGVFQRDAARLQQAQQQATRRQQRRKASAIIGWCHRLAASVCGRQGSSCAVMCRAGRCSHTGTASSWCTCQGAGVDLSRLLQHQVYCAVLYCTVPHCFSDDAWYTVPGVACMSNLGTDMQGFPQRRTKLNGNAVRLAS